MEWAEYRGPKPADIKAGWACMHDEIMALGVVFEMQTGQFKTVYSQVGQLVPTVDGPFFKLKAAKRHVETVVERPVGLKWMGVRPRPVLLDSGFVSSKGTINNGR